MTRLKRSLRRLLFWGLPVAILYIVFRKIDLELLKANVLRVNLLWLVLGLGIHPLIMVLGASRWYYQLRIHFGDQVTLAQASRFYWMGFPLTLFFPSGLGWDAHRALVSGRKYGRFAVNAGVIFVEKVIALIATMLLIVTVYPFALPYASSAVHQQVFSYALLFLAVILFVLGITTLSLKYHVAAGLLDRADRYFTRKIRATLTTIGASDPFDSANTSIRNFLLPLANPRRFGPVLVFSIAIQVASAVAAQIYFIAAGYDIPFAVNLFVGPLVFLALVLPISFGGLGIREAAYIVLYGQFGIPMEIALLVSFFTLMGVLLNYAIGGLMLWHHGAQQ